MYVNRNKYMKNIDKTAVYQAVDANVEACGVIRFESD